MAVAKRHWLRMVLAFAGMLIDSVTILVVPLLLRWAIDILTHPDAAGGAAVSLGVGGWRLSPASWQLARIALFSLGLALVRAAGIYLEIFMQESVGNWIARDLRSLLFQKMLRLPFAFFDRRQTGDIMSRLTKDVSAVQDGTGFVVLITIVNIFQVAGAVAAMLLMDPTLTLVVLLIAPPVALITLAYTKAVSPLYREVEARSGTLHTVAQENISGIRVVKAFTRAPEEIEKFEKENEALFTANLRIARLSSLVGPALDLMSVLLSLVILGYGGYRAATGTLELGTLMAFSSYAAFLYWPLRQTGWLADLISKALAGAVRIFDLLDEQEQPLGGPVAPVNEVRGQLEFRNVSFAYKDADFSGVSAAAVGGAEGTSAWQRRNGDDDGYALRGFNLIIRPGERVAIIGGTGSGKTTVANLIARFYDPTAGQVLLDGRDLREWPLEQLRRAVGFVFQDNFLFSLSVRDNICLGLPGADPAKVQEAAEAAQIAATIERLPHGYDTVVGERGIGLSGGERQRIALARALLVNPPILVLDDSTASLDAHTENAVQAALDRRAAGRTVVIIAQRVATAMRADRIVVMDKGVIVQEGTHAELVAQEGIYRQLYREQMALRASRPVGLDSDVDGNLAGDVDAVQAAEAGC